MLVEEASIPRAALPIEAFRQHVRLGTGFADDAVQDVVLENFLRAALAAIEARTGKILIERGFVWSIPGWRDCVEQALPVAPVGAVTEVNILDRLGQATRADPDSYRLIYDLQRPRLRATGAALPKVPVQGSVEIRFRAGFGPNWADLPADLGQAVLMLAAHYHEYRQGNGVEDSTLPFGVSSLIQRYRSLRLFGGGRS